MGLSKVFNGFSFFLWLAFIWGTRVKHSWAASDKLNLDTEIDPVATPMPSMFSLFIKLLVSLILVGGLAYLTIKFLRKNARLNSNSESISVLDQFAMGMNKGLFIVDVAGKVLVLGVTDHNINVLYEIKDEDLIGELRAKADEGEGQPILPPGFWDAIMAKRRSVKKPESSFSNHIQEQIRKLKVTVGGSQITDAGKDESHEQEGH